MKTSAAVTIYVAERKAMGWADTTATSARSILWNFADACPPQIGSIKRRHVTDWLSAPRDGRTLTPATQRTRLSVVRTFCTWLVERGHLRKNPTAGLKVIVTKKGVPRSLSSEEVAAALRLCVDRRDRALLLLLVHLGLRRAEAVAIHLQHIDFNERNILIAGKGGREDWMPVPDEAWRALTAYLHEWPATSGPLFRSYTTGRQLSPAWASRAVSRIMFDAGVKRTPGDGRSAHALRHTMIMDTLKRTRDPQATRAASRHESWGAFGVYTRAALGAEQLRPTVEGRSYLTS